MARAAGRAKTWVWYLAGCLCAVVWGRSAAAGTRREPPPPPYGVVTPVRVEVTRKKADKLVDEYLAPVPAKAPDEKAGKEIKRLVATFGAGDYGKREAASRAVVKHGTAALGELRKTLASKDAEVRQRASLAIAAVEAAARKAIVDRLKALGAAARQVAIDRNTRAKKVVAAEARLAEEARRAGKKAKAEKAEARERAARERVGMLSQLVRELVMLREVLPPLRPVPRPPMK